MQKKWKLLKLSMKWESFFFTFPSVFCKVMFFQLQFTLNERGENFPDRKKKCNKLRLIEFQILKLLIKSN